jgi:hypothetical protein
VSTDRPRAQSLGVPLRTANLRLRGGGDRPAQTRRIAPADGWPTMTRSRPQTPPNHSTTPTALPPAPGVKVRCALPVAIHIPLPGEYHDQPSPCPVLLGCGRLQTLGDCWRRASALVARRLLVDGLLALRQPVARRRLADPAGMSAQEGPGSRRGPLLALVAARTPLPDPARQRRGRVARGDRLVAAQPRRSGHRR